MREELLGLIETGRAREAEQLVPLVDDSQPAAPGRWTAKDNLAHLSAWRDVAIADLDHAVRGTSLAELAETDDEQNAKFYAETHAIPAGEVIEGARRSWAALAERVRACTEEQLASPRPRHADQELWQAVPGNSFSHLAEHLGYWYGEAGDDARAEGAAVWAYEIAAAIPSEAVRGFAEYNFACFYAKRGLAHAALPYLRMSIEARPELREWGAKDTDLDPIRADPEVAALLKG